MKRDLHRELHQAAPLWPELKMQNISWSGLALSDRAAIVRAIAHDSELVAQLTREIGHNMQTTTYFSRRKQVLKGAMERIASKLPKKPTVLEIGLGLNSPLSGIHSSKIDTQTNQDYWRSLASRQYVYEPFEVLAMMERYRFLDTKLVAFDIDPLVLATLRYQTEMIVESTGEHCLPYYQSFLQRVSSATPVPMNKQDADTQNPKHLVQLPQHWIDSVNAVQGDVETSVPYEQFFDLALCFSVLIYVRDKDNGIDAALLNIVRALRIDGYLLTTSIDHPRHFGLEEIKSENFGDQHCFRKVKEVR